MGVGRDPSTAILLRCCEAKSSLRMTKPEKTDRLDAEGGGQQAEGEGDG
jgi:hypothetical protein